MGEKGPEISVSKELLCMQSKYFDAMFRRDAFKEGETNAAYLDEINGIVSVASFEALVQWLHRGTVTFPAGLKVSDEITKCIEFVRLADMCIVTYANSPNIYSFDCTLRRS